MAYPWNIVILKLKLLILVTSSTVLLTNPSSHPASQSLLTIPLHKKLRLKQQPHYHPEKVEATMNLYPNVNGYAVFLWVGTPSQILLARIDTATHFTWAQCQPCSACYPQTRPLFDSRASATLQELAGDSPACTIPDMRDVFFFPQGSSCRFNLKYAEQSRSLGRVVIDLLTLVPSNTILEQFVMGCADSHEGPFSTHFSAVLGLGRGPLSLQSQLRAEAFSLCLSLEKPSLLSFHGASPPKENYDSNSIAVPLSQKDRYPHYYFVQFVGIGVDGFMLDIPSRVWGYGLNYDSGVIVDTGSNLMRLPSEAYSVFGSEIRRKMGNFRHRLVGPEGLEFCYDEEPSSVYPEIELYFENGSIEGENLVTLKLSDEQIVLRPEEGVVCLAFREGKDPALTVIGNIQLLGTLLTYDLAKDLAVFTPGKC
ncbi:aspartic proteinase nepenthesin-2-like [Prosopis cineraria]|uniref:aspartic proteinase nepenthesin-2-like n=1 Tax=Prosopis cineraria TaxID=364024 RepID=UPI00240F179A|nr:aspartic proteinase nepenthesin-2-like [Prosopis cineraria]